MIFRESTNVFHETVDHFLVVFSAIILPVIIGIVIRSSLHGWLDTYAAIFTSLGFIILLTAFRKKIPSLFKRIAVLILVYFALLAALKNWGLFGTALLLPFVLNILSAFFFSTVISVSIVLFTTLTISLRTFLIGYDGLYVQAQSTFPDYYIAITVTVAFLALNLATVLAILYLKAKLFFQLNLNQALSEVSQKIIEKDSFASLHEIILNAGLNLTDSRFGFVGYIDTNTGYLVAPTLTSEIWDQCHVENKSYIFKEFKGIWGKVITEKTEILSNNLKKDSRSTGAPPGHILMTSFLSVPVFKDNEVIGQIALGNSRRKYLQSDLVALRKLAGLYAVAVSSYYERQRSTQREKMLQQQSKMAAMGEMLGTIAHQWRQPLNTVGLLVQDIEDAYKDQELQEKTLSATVNDIMKQIHYMSSTIDNFRNFIKPSKESKNFDLKQTIENAFHLLSPDLKYHHIDLTFNNKENKPVIITGFQNELTQVFLVLVNNARDSILKRQQNSDSDYRGRVEISLQIEESYAKIEISDNGNGISKEIIPRLFQAYTTTKGDEGTGIGLYMSRSILEGAMNGKIYSLPKEDGARFIIELPLGTG